MAAFHWCILGKLSCILQSANYKHMRYISRYFLFVKITSCSYIHNQVSLFTLDCVFMSQKIVTNPWKRAGIFPDWVEKKMPCMLLIQNALETAENTLALCTAISIITLSQQLLRFVPQLFLCIMTCSDCILQKLLNGGSISFTDVHIYREPDNDLLFHIFTVKKLKALLTRCKSSPRSGYWTSNSGKLLFDSMAASSWKTGKVLYIVFTFVITHNWKG